MQNDIQMVSLGNSIPPGFGSGSWILTATLIQFQDDIQMLMFVHWNFQPGFEDETLEFGSGGSVSMIAGWFSQITGCQRWRGVGCCDEEYWIWKRDAREAQGEWVKGMSVAMVMIFIIIIMTQML